MEVGQIITIYDDIDYNITHNATIKLIEKDEEINGLYWLYLRANEEELNTNVDPRIGTFWRIIESTSEKILNPMDF